MQNYRKEVLKFRRFVLQCCIVLLLPITALAQTNPASQAARKWRQEHERAIVDEFVSLLSIPNVSRDRDNIQRNAQAIAAMLESMCVSPQATRVMGSAALTSPSTRHGSQASRRSSSERLAPEVAAR